MGWWAGGLVGWWAGGLVGWWAGGLVGWWAGGLVGWWVGGLVGWWRWLRDCAVSGLRAVPVAQLSSVNPGGVKLRADHRP